MNLRKNLVLNARKCASLHKFAVHLNECYTEHMEFVQAFLFTSKYLLGRSGNTDIYFLFAAFALLFYAWKRRDKAALIVKLSIPIAIICGGMVLFYPDINTTRTWVFFLKTLLNITLMVFVAANCKRWKIRRFVEAVAWIHAAETAIALIIPKSSLWITAIIPGTDIEVNRLRLFYMDPEKLAFACILVIIIITYKIITEDIVWRYVAALFVMILDLILSVGGPGHTKELLKSFDNFLADKLIAPFQGFVHTMQITHLMGVGFGNGNTAKAVQIFGTEEAFPNSFIRIMAEGGIFGIIFVFLCIFILGHYAFKYGNGVDKALYLCIVIYQMVGGYYTDATTSFIYGWIIGDCLNNKVARTGNCRIALFLPKQKEKLKIAMIGHKRIPSREGGVEIVVEELSTRLTNLGHSVDAYNRSGQHVSGSEFNLVDYDALKEYKGVKIIKIPTIERKGIAAFVYSMIASIYVGFKDYDLVHYHAEGPCAFIFIPSMFGIRTIATIHGLDWARSGKWGSLASSFIKFGEKMATMYADEIIVLSRHVQQYFKERYYRETTLIPNGVDRPEKRDASVIKDKWNLDKDSYVLALSRMTKEKKIDLLIDAYRDVNTDKKLVIAGGSSDTDAYVVELHEMAEEDDRVLFTGFVQGQELEELYSNAYVYVLPSELEGMPLSLLEAMSYGNCCLTSDITENTDVVRNHGYSFRTNDREDLTERLQKLIDDPEKVQRYKSEASDYICKKYNWDDVVDRTLKVYRKGF